MRIGTIQIESEPLMPPNTSSEVTRAYNSTTPNLVNKLKSVYSPTIGAGINETNYSRPLIDTYSSIQKSSLISNLGNKLTHATYSENPTIKVSALNTYSSTIRN